MEKSKNTLAYPHLQKEDFIARIVQKHKSQVVHALTWNSIESFLYHALFLTHQTALYAVAGQHTYGMIGTLFSFSFLCITIASLGLDTALLPFIRTLAEHVNKRYLLFFTYIVPHFLGVLFLTPCILVLLKLVGWYAPLATYNYTTLLMLSIFIAVETVRKIIRHLLQFLFYNKYTALLEIGMITGYCILFWCGYLLGFSPAHPLAVLVPFVFVSCGSVFYLIISLHKKILLPTYDPTTEDINDDVTTTRNIVAKNQVLVTVNTIARLFFSSNFLIPLCAATMGYMHAGIATLAHYITHTITFMLHKIMVPTITALFMVPENMHNYALKKITFLVTLITFFIGIMLLIGIAGVGLWYMHYTIDRTTIWYVCCFLLLHIVEQLFTLYEKFFASCNQFSPVTIAHVISACTSLSVWWCTSSFMLLLPAFLGVRLLALSILSYKIWYKNIFFKTETAA